MSSLLRIVVVLVTIVCALPPYASGQALFDRDQIDLLHEELSGELAKEHVIAITRHHRIQGSRGYRDASDYVLDQLRSFGFSEEDAFVESFVSDGRTTYQTWPSPSGWDIERAELRMVEPYDERIVGYPEIAMSLITYSNPGHVRAELVDVGSGESDTDYVGKDVRGKFVLATGYGGSVHRLAVLKYGAAAVVCFLDDDRAAEYPDMLAYTGMWPKPDELEQVTFGFNLTNRQGSALRKRLARGERVVLEGTVEGTGLEPFFMDVPVAVIRGTDRTDEEILFSAHLDHPKESANDNASGSAALLDIARSINQLIAAGRMQRPSRTLRFIWVPEWSGTMAYIDAHEEMKGPSLGGKVLANLNLDMVGENLEILHSQMRFTRTPASLPSALNEIVEEAARTVAGMDIRTPRGSLSTFNYVVQPYSGGSDHMMFIDRKIPAMMFSHSPDYTHHTSEDTPDKVDPVELERAEIIGALSALFIANVDDDKAKALAARVGARAAAETILASSRGLDRTAFDLIVERQLAALKSVLDYRKSEEATKAVNQYSQHVSNMAGQLRKGLPTVTLKADDRVPVRLTRGPLEFSLPESALDEERRRWYAESVDARTLSNSVRFEAVNFIDGNRSVAEIERRVVTEYTGVTPGAVVRLLEDLVRAGVVSWR